jgi:hypothetical protein
MNVLLIVIIYHLLKLQNEKFNILDVYYIIYLCFIIMLLFKGRRSVIILIFLIITLKLYIPLYAIFGVMKSILSSNKFKTYKNVSMTLYDKYLNLKINREKITLKTTIFVANYVSNYIEYMVHGLLCDKLCLILKKKGADYIRYIYGDECVIPCDKNTYKIVERKVKYKIKKGYSIFSYVERDSGKRKNEYEVSSFRSGIFNIAKKLNVTITPICIDHLRHNYGIIKNNKFQVKIGETFYVENVEKAMDNVKKFFKYELNQMKKV